MTYFEETQYFRQKWLWIIILFFPLFSIYGLYKQVLMGIPIGDHPMSDRGVVWFSVLIGLGLPFLFWNLKLKIKVTKEGLYYQFFPIHLKYRLIPFEDIKSYKARTYEPLKEFGGWGIRFGFKGKAYHVSGDKGLQLVLNNERQVLFGSQHHKELAKAMSKANKKS